MTQTNLASFSFDPVSIQTRTGDTFPVDVLIYSGSDPVISSDIWVRYDPNVLELVPQDTALVTARPLFATVETKPIAPGSLYLYALKPVSTQAGATNGVIATLHFRTKTAATTHLQFDCIPFEEKTSQIIRQDPELTNIINCDTTRTHQATVTVAGSEVLGVSDRMKQGIINPWYFSAGVVLMVIAGMVLFRYRQLIHKRKGE